MERKVRRIPPSLLPLLLLGGASSRIDETYAFTFHPTGRRYNKSRQTSVTPAKFITSRQVPAPPKAETVGLLEYGDDNGDSNDPAQDWLKWMYTGSPRRTDEVAMREPAALGGLPRSDRYSSR